jgi:zinc D-Ala-D-Ala carboxypeptidase
MTTTEEKLKEVAPNFSISELACKHCGELCPYKGYITFMEKVQALRDWYGKPMDCTSGYRCPDHPVEANKGNTTGQHVVGAVDLHIPNEDYHKVLKKAFEMGFTGIGVKIKGPHSGRFIHLDTRTSGPRVWSY